MDLFTPQTVSEKHKTVISHPVQSTIFPGTEYRDDYGKIHPSDSYLWLRMFILAHEKHGADLCSILMFIRNTGAVLIPNQQYGYVIQPVIGKNGWTSMDEYNQERKCMVKYKAEIIELLKELKNATSKGF